MTAIFITATGTDIGKTFVAAGLVRHWRAAGRNVNALKPIITGYNPAEAQASDAGILLTALSRSISLAEVDRVSPWRFAAPLSPDMAARREYRSVEFGAVVDFCRGAIAANTDTLLIEGIGGIMVPLDREHTVLDWMISLEIPVVVVTGTYLGSLSHTLTCLDVLAGRGLSVKAVIVNETPGSTVALQDTSDTLSRFAPTIPFMGLRRLSPGPNGLGVFAQLAELLEQ